MEEEEPVMLDMSEAPALAVSTNMVVRQANDVREDLDETVKVN